VGSKAREEVERRVGVLASGQAALETSAASAESVARAASREVAALQGELTGVKTSVDKAAKAVEENGSKIFGCVHDCGTLRDAVEKVKKAAERRPAADEVDKKSELSNKLYNDLAVKIEDVDSNLQKEVKKTRSEAEKSNKDLTRLQISVDEANKEVKFLKEDATAIKMNVAEMKNCPKDISTLKTECDKMCKDVRGVSNNVDDVKKEISTIKAGCGSATSMADKIKILENDLNVVKKDKSIDKLATVEKDITSLRADHEKLSKDVKTVSTEVKFFDSTLKKEAASTKTEFSTISKTVKDVQKEVSTVYNMVEVLNNQFGSSSNSDDLTQVKSDLVKISTEIKDSIAAKCKVVEDSLKKKIAADIAETDTKVTKTKDELNSKLTVCATDVKALEKRIEANTKGIDSGEVDKRVKSAKDELNMTVDTKLKAAKDELNSKQAADMKSIEKKMESSSKGLESGEVDKRLKTAKDELTSTMDTKLKAAKDEFTTKVSTCTTEVKALEKRIEGNTKGIDSGEVDKRVKSAKEELNAAIEAKLKTTKDEFCTKVESCSKEVKALDKKIDTNGKGVDSAEVDKKVKSSKDELNTAIENKVKVAKEELSTKITTCSTEVKALEKRIEANSKGIDSGEVDKRVKSAKDELTAKITTDNKALEKKVDATAADVKKICDLGVKVTKQEESLTKLKTTVDGLETSSKSSKASGVQTGDELKKEMDKMNQALKDSMKSMETKLATQETTTKGLDTLKTGLTAVESKVKEIDTIKTSIKAVESKASGVETSMKTIEKTSKENAEKIGDTIDPPLPWPTAGKLEKAASSTPVKTDDAAKKDLDKLSKTVTDKIDKVSQHLFNH
jgi:chromosome segregation ATPase